MSVSFGVKTLVELPDVEPEPDDAELEESEPLHATRVSEAPASATIATRRAHRSRSIRNPTPGPRITTLMPTPSVAPRAPPPNLRRQTRSWRFLRRRFAVRW